jgi:hypothetical protein
MNAFPVGHTIPVLIRSCYQSYSTHDSADQLHPLVEPQVLHFMQVPLRTSVKFPHEPQASPS